MKTILIVDDHAIAREPLARLLRYEGYETVCAANGLEALDVMRRRGHGTPDRIDLVLLDLMMPKLGGIGFLRSLRSDTEISPQQIGLPIIVLTSVIDSSEVGQALELGAAEVIEKAKFEVDELLRRIRARLHQVVDNAA